MSVEKIFEGIYRVPDPRNPGKKLLATLNLTSGRAYYGEQRIKTDLGEFRSWDPFRSKLSAAVLRGLKHMPFASGTACLYLGASTGTTVSHISDIVGGSGRIFAVEVSGRVARELLEKVVKFRKNVIPIVADAREPEKYPAIYGVLSVIYCDIAQQDQTEIAITNCRRFFGKGHDSLLLLVIKASSIDATREKRLVFEDQVRTLEGSGFEIFQKIDLEPYDKNHALVVARLKVP